MLVRARGDAEAAAEVERPQLPAELVAGAGGEGRDPVDGDARGAEVAQLEPMCTWSPSVSGARRSASSAVVGREAELRAVVAGADRLVRVGLDPGRDADQRARDAGGAGAVDLLERVDHDERAGRRGRGELLVATCCCRGRRARRRRSRPPARSGARRASRRRRRSPPRRGAASAPRSGTPSSRRRRRVRRGFAVGAGPGAQRRLVVDDERAAVRGRARTRRCRRARAPRRCRSVGKSRAHGDSACGRRRSVTDTSHVP